MASALNFKHQNDVIQKSLVESIKEIFPIEKNGKVLELTDISLEDNLNDFDFPAQKEIKLNRKSWQNPVYGSFVLKDSDGKILSKKEKIKIGYIPKLTNRHTMLIDGNEYQTTNQIRRKSGIYSRLRQNGELEAEFNLSKGQNFKMQLDPEDQVFYISFENRKYRLWTLLNILGVSDSEISKTWGPKLLEINKAGALNTEASELTALYKRFYKKDETDFRLVLEGINKYFKNNTEVDPETTELTLGKPFKIVDGTTLLAASEKLLKVSKGDAQLDDRDSLIFKHIYSADDLLHSYFEAQKPALKSKLERTLGLKTEVRDIITPGTFTDPIKKFFTTGDLSSTPVQTNPLMIVSEIMKTTVMGTGGIKNQHSVTDETRNVEPTQLGFLDPNSSPESLKIGLAVGLASEVQKVGKEMKTPVYDSKEDKLVLFSPLEYYKNIVGFPDQRKLKDTEMIKVMHEGVIKEMPKKEVRYFLRSPKSMFSLQTNLMPFLQNTQTNRTLTGSRMMTQALPLDEKEIPLVQVKRDNKGTYEDYIGSFLNPFAEDDGEVIKIDDNYIHIKHKDSVKKYGLFKDFPLNQDGYLNSTPVVKVGDKVNKNKMLAESNYSVDSTLAMGKNLNVAYMSYKGLNFEDGVVITESAAKALTHSTIHRENIYYNPKLSVLNKSKFSAWFPEEITPENYKKLDDKGIIKVGETVKPGDVLAAFLVEREMDDIEKALKKLDKYTFNNYSKNITYWDEEDLGEISDVRFNGRNIDIYIKAKHPFKLGDKVAGSWGNKGIVTKIIPDSEAPRTKDGKVVQIIMSPEGVPGRMNIGQILATAAGKIAEKTGKPYIVDNFDDPKGDAAKKVLDEMKALGIEPNEELYDGATGEKIEKPIFTGKQYIYKLRHIVKKKQAAHSLGAYDIDEQPAGKGAQKIGILDSYAYLAHGAKANLREYAEIKGRSNEDYWRDLQFGLMPGKPNRNFVFEKMVSYLKGAGVNVEKNGNKIKIFPLRDQDVEQLSKGKLEDPGAMLIGKNLESRKGGLFDVGITGGMRGKNWAHIELGERIPNPMYEDAITKILNLSEKDYNLILTGKKELNGKTGIEAIIDSLKNLDVDKELPLLKEELKTTAPTNVNKLNTRIKYLNTLKELNYKPLEAYTITKLPVIPPQFRPVYPLPSGDLMVSDLNKHYRDVGVINKNLTEAKDLLGEEDKIKFTNDLYSSVKALQGFADPITYSKTKYKGITAELGEMKTGLIQGVLWTKRQDLSARSTITVNPDLGLDEMGVPKEMAYKIFKPFIIKEMKESGVKPSDALKYYKEEDPLAWNALNSVANSRPVILNRAPSLHKHSVQAFKPVIVDGKALQLNPLINKGFNADYDGDSISAYITMTYEIHLMLNKAKNEYFKKNEKYLEYDLDFDEFISYIKDIHLTNYAKDMLKEAYINYLNTGTNSFFNIHIKDLPHSEIITKNTDKVLEYEVPEYIKVFALENGKQTLKTVTRFSIHNDLKMLKIKTSSGKEVIASDDHSLICFNPETNLVEKIKPIDALSKLTPIPAKLETDVTIEKGFDFGWFIGCFVGDGWLNGEDTKSFYKNKNALHLANVDKNVIEKFGNFIGYKGYSVKNTHDFKGYDCTSIKTTWANEDITKYLRDNTGHGAINKSLPKDFLSWDEEARFGILSGLLDTDGSLAISNAKKTPQYLCNYTTVSDELTYQVQQLLASLGIRSSVTNYTKNEDATLAKCINISMVDLVKNKNKINLQVSTKKEILNKASVSKDDKDIIPISFDLANNLKNFLISNKETVLYTILSKASKTGYIGRDSAKKIISLINEILKNSETISELRTRQEFYLSILNSVKLGKTSIEEMLELLKKASDLNITLLKQKINYFKSIPIQNAKAVLSYKDVLEDIDFWKVSYVTNENLYWDKIASVEEDSETVGYDLTVPGPYVFMTSNLLTVQDTMSVHVPVSNEAVEEAYGMMPSKILFKQGDNQLMPELSKDYIFGVHALSKIEKDSKKSFKSIDEAKKAGLNWNDKFLLNGKPMTIGQWELNSVLPENLKNYNRELTSKEAGKLLEDLAKKDADKFTEVINHWKTLGANYAYKKGHTVSITDFAVDHAYRDNLLKTELPKIQKLKGEQKITALNNLTKKVEEAQASTVANTNFSNMLRSGSFGKKDSIRQVISMPGVLVDVNGAPIPIPLTKSYGEGLDTASYWTSLYGARKGTVDRAVNTQESGALNKSLLSVTRKLLVTQEDCNADDFIEIEVSSKDVMDRCLAETISGIGKRNDIINSDIIQKARSKGLLKLPVRSPLTCETPEGVCQKCYGLGPDGKLPTLGTNVGVLDAQAVTERSTQLVMKCADRNARVFVRSESLGIDSEVTHEELWNLITNPTIIQEKIELKSVPDDLEILTDSGFKKVKLLQRHLPEVEMLFIKLEDGNGFITQKDHPLLLVDLSVYDPDFQKDFFDNCLDKLNSGVLGFKVDYSIYKDKIHKREDITMPGYDIGYSFINTAPNSIRVYEYSKKIIIDILSGYIDKYGQVLNSKEGSYVEMPVFNFSLAQQFYIALRSLNYKIDTAQSHRYKGKEYVTMMRFKIDKDDLELFNKSFQIKKLYKSKDTVFFEFNFSQDTLKMSDWKIVKYDGYTYDIPVEGEKYLINGIAYSNTFHTGGSALAKGGVTESFPRLEQLLKVPEKLSGKATISSIDGIVDSIEKNLTGGYNIKVSGKLFVVPAGRLPIVSQGQKVKAGDALSDGSIKPQELSQFKDHLSAQKYLVNELNNIYEDKFYKKTFETVIRGITDNAEITKAPDDTGLLKGDKMSKSYLDYLNKERKKQRLDLIEYKPYFKSIDVANTYSDDWLTRISTNRVKASLANSAARGMYTNIKGKDPVPAYLYGEGFGQNLNFEKGEFY